MTAQELAERFGISESYVKANFEKLQKNVLKNYGIKIVKVKDGRFNRYFLEEAPSKLDLPIEERAVSLIAEPPGKKIFIENSWRTELDEFSFMLLVALFCMPRAQFKGSIIDFMKYAGIKKTNDKKALAKASFIELSLRQLVALSYIKDDEILVKGIPPKIKKDGRYITFTVGQVIKCVQLTLKYGLSNWGNCLRVWLAAQDLSLGAENIAISAGIKENEVRRCIDALKNMGLISS